jgi:pimeloyl-ACP methyl ester carboxylesterase
LIVDGLNVSAKVIGQGPHVLLLHGWGRTHADFLPIAERLSKEGFACHVLDLPGFGDSEMPRAAWDVPRYAEFVRAYMDTAQLDAVTLIGHSFGGRISIVLAADCPGRVNKVVLVSSAGLQLPPSPKMRLYYASRKIIFGMLRLPLLNRFEPGVRQWFWERYASDDLKAARSSGHEAIFRAVIAQDLRDYAARIKAPTLLIWGDMDSETPLRYGQIFEQIIPDAGLVVVEGAGHDAHLQRPDFFVRVISVFLQGE